MIGFAGGFHPQGVRGGDARRVDDLLSALPHFDPQQVLRCNKFHVLMGGGTLSPLSGAGGPAIRGDWTVVLAGELDNLPALRREMQARHLEGPEVSAAELAARIFGECGVEHALERLEGDFSFAAWDASAGALWLSRGRAGAWPIWMTGLTSGATVFSTSLRALCAVSPHLTPDPEAAQSFLNAGHLAEGQAPFQEVRALAAGEVRVVHDSGERRVTLWDPGPAPSGRGGERPKWARSLNVTAHLATNRRSPEGAALGLLDGGGAFSGAIAQSLARAGRPVARISLGPPETDLRDLEHLGGFDALVRSLDTPPPSPDLVAQHAGFQALADVGAQAALGGWGGAELFHATQPRRGRRARLIARLLPAELVSPSRPLLSDALLAPLAALAQSEGLVLRAPLLDPHFQALVAQVPLGYHLEGDRGLFLAAFAEELAAQPPGTHAPMALPLEPWVEGLLDERIDGAIDALAAWLPEGSAEPTLLPERPDDTRRLRTWRALSWAAWFESLDFP